MVLSLVECNGFQVEDAKTEVESGTAYQCFVDRNAVIKTYDTYTQAIQEFDDLYNLLDITTNCVANVTTF